MYNVLVVLCCVVLRYNVKAALLSREQNWSHLYLGTYFYFRCCYSSRSKNDAIREAQNQGRYIIEHAHCMHCLWVFLVYYSSLGMSSSLFEFCLSEVIGTFEKRAISTQLRPCPYVCPWLDTAYVCVAYRAVTVTMIIPTMTWSLRSSFIAR